MSRMRVEGLLAAFPKLMGTGRSKQHQFVDTDTVRYIYQPIESLFILLITNRASNIVEDLETLRLLSKVVPDVAGGVTEEKVCDAVFELIFAFDEVLTAGGYKEGLPLSTIKANLEMESHEEKLHMMIKQSKEDAAKDEAKRQAKAIKERQMQMMKQQLGGGGGPPSASGMQGFGGGGNNMGGGSQDPFSMMGMSDPYSNQSGGGGDFGGSSDPYGGGGASASFNPSSGTATVSSAPRNVKVGMKLGGKKTKGKKDDLMHMMAAEDGLSPMPLAPARPGVASMEVTPPPAAPQHPVTLLVEEKVSVSMSAEGEVQSCEIKGTLSLTANEDAGANVVSTVDKAAIDASSIPFSVNTHPKIDKKQWEQGGQLAIKGGKSIPVGRPIGVLRWSYSDPEACPLTLTCWVEEDGASMNLNLEYEAKPGMSLKDVSIVIPGVHSPPRVSEVDGQYKHDTVSGSLIWYNSVIDDNNSSGALEFNVEGASSDFFPIPITFKSEKLFFPFNLLSVQSGSGDVNYDLQKSLAPDQYICGS
ncbi:hypothetical protein TrVE_jg5976 [Triparma verrucosa]|uniref:Coatomer subunit delta n=1 Tax=Triparma verrucosa TaxID=1606542 RepID=A0A9W7EU33_9STRA|nr:hypothetical protein TrVE_jg5976 [Triparma verrucosa]